MNKIDIGNKTKIDLPTFSIIAAIRGQVDTTLSDHRKIDLETNSEEFYKPSISPL